jgi:hypothetical protein
VDEAGVAAGDVARTDHPDALTLDSAVGEVRVVAELLAACARLPDAAGRGVVPCLRAGYGGAVQVRDATQTAKSEREGELGDALPPEALAGLHVVAYAPGRQRLAYFGRRPGGEDSLPQSGHPRHALHRHGYVQGDEAGDAGRIGHDLTNSTPIVRAELQVLGLTLRFPQHAEVISSPGPRPVEVGVNDNDATLRLSGRHARILMRSSSEYRVRNFELSIT